MFLYLNDASDNPKIISHQSKDKIYYNYVLNVNLFPVYYLAGLNLILGSAPSAMDAHQVNPHPEVDCNHITLIIHKVVAEVM